MTDYSQKGIIVFALNILLFIMQKKVLKRRVRYPSFVLTLKFEPFSQLL